MIKIIRKQDLGFKLLALVVSAVIGWVIYTGYQRQAQIDALVSAYAEERAATRARGETPVGPEPSEILKDPNLRGKPGRGIADTATEGCYVRLIFTDDTRTRVGPFCGRDGEDGEDGSTGPTGPAGVSITSVTTDGCMIVITLSNEETIETGPFCGPKGDKGDKGDKGEPGRSIVDSECVQNDDGWRWRIEYDNDGDGETDDTDNDAGPCNGSDQASPSPTSPVPTSN